MKRVLILTNSFEGLYYFRFEVIKELAQNYKLYISGPKSQLTPLFESLDVQVISYALHRRSKNPFNDFKLFLFYKKQIKRNEIDLILSYTIKPNIYGGLAARMMKVPFIPNITGLGTAVENKGLLQKITVFLYRWALKKAQCVSF